MKGRQTSVHAAEIVSSSIASCFNYIQASAQKFAARAAFGVGASFRAANLIAGNYEPPSSSKSIDSHDGAGCSPLGNYALGSIRCCGSGEQASILMEVKELPRKRRIPSWVAVKELALSYHNMDMVNNGVLGLW